MNGVRVIHGPGPQVPIEFTATVAAYERQEGWHDTSDAAALPLWLARYVERGFQLVFWRRANSPTDTGKGPREEGWPTKLYEPADYRAGMQVGVKLGTEIAPRRFLVDVDFDWSPGIRFADKFLPPTGFGFGRASKPIGHVFYTTSAPVASKKFQDTGSDRTTLVELRGTKTDGSIGLQTVLPPSRHYESGELVKLHADGEIQHNDAAVDGLTLYAVACLLGRHWPRNGPTTNQHDTAGYVAAFLCRAGVDLQHVPSIVEVAATLGNDDNVNDRVRFARDTVAKFKAGNNRLKAGPHLAKEVGDDVVARLKEWLADGDSTEFQCDKNGKVIANNQFNIKHALELLNVKPGHDAFTDTPLLTVSGQRREFNDEALDTLWLQVDEHFRFLPSKDLFHTVVRVMAWKNKHHPVKQYLDALQWDGQHRIDEWLIAYAGAKDTEFVRAVSALMLIAAVRRVRSPGCKFDEMPVLESEQGRGKSSALRALCPNEDWFSDDLPLNVDAKQVIERTLGKWLIEASELNGASKSRAEHLKAMLSRQTDGPVRLAYARQPVSRARHFIIVGSTNAGLGYLKDSTGNRRFWPVRVEQFDLEALKRDRDQLWAEAAVREAAGESIRLDPRLYSHAEEEQKQRELDDPWFEVLAEFIGDSKQVESGDVWSWLEKHANQRDPRDAARVAEVMQKLGFTRKEKVRVLDQNGKRVQRVCWFRDGAERELPYDGEERSV